MDRRSFLAGCATCAVRLACTATAANSLVTGIARAQTPSEKPRIRLVFSHITPEKPTWPYQGFDYEGRKKELAAKLTADCPNMEFLPVTAMNANDARQILMNDSEVDGYVVYMMGLWPRAGDVIDKGSFARAPQNLVGTTQLPRRAWEGTGR